MTPHDAMLQRILDRPEDDEARLAYAAWLEGHGDEVERARGAFIRLDVTLDRMTADDPGRSAVEAAREEVLRRYGLARLLGLGAWADRLQWPGWVDLGRCAETHRGFAEWVAVDAENFLRDAVALGQSPTLRCALSDAGPAQLAALAGCPAFVRLADLQIGTIPFNSGNLGPDGAAALARIPFTSLETLGLAYQQITDDGISALAKAGTLAHLNRIRLNGNALGDAGAAALATASMPKLKVLELGHNRIGPDGARALAAAPWASGLESLVLGGNPLGDDGVEALTAIPFIGLRTLELDKVEMTGRGAAALASAHWMAGLGELHLSNNHLGPDAAGALTTLAASASLKKLYLLECGLGDEGAATLARSGRLCSLELLQFMGNGLTDAGVTALAACDAPALEDLCLNCNPVGAAGLYAVLTSRSLPRLKRLLAHDAQVGPFNVPVDNQQGKAGVFEELGLASNPLDGDALAVLLRLPKVSGVRTLDLSGGEGQTPLGPAGARAVAASPRLTRLRTLQLPGQEIGDEGAIVLAGSLHLAALEEVQLANNRIGPAGVAALARSANLAGLTWFILSGNPFGEEGALALAAARWRRVNTLAVAGCGISPEGAAALLEAELPSLAHLGLSENPLGDSGAVAISRAASRPALRGLSLDSTGIGDTGVGVLAASPLLGTLETLNLSDNPIGVAGARALAGSAYLNRLISLRVGDANLPAEARDLLRERFGHVFTK